MKFSVILSLLILVFATFLGVRDRQRLAGIRQSYDAIAAEAATIGLPVEAIQPGPAALRFTRKNRSDPTAEANRAVAEMLGFIDEMNAWDLAAENHELTASQQQRSNEMAERLAGFDAAQLKRFITALDARPDLVPEIRGAYTGFAMVALGGKDPLAALGLILEMPDLPYSREQAIATSIATWAETDPLAALGWMQNQGEAQPEFLSESLKSLLIASAAARDPRLALQLLGRVNLTNPENASSGIVDSASTSGEKIELMNALRSHLAATANDRATTGLYRSTIRNLAVSVSADGFESATRWLADAGLSPGELDEFSESISRSGNIPSAETGQWLDWFQENYHGDSSLAPSIFLMGSWTEKDYLAAAKWLESAPDGPAKTKAVGSYASTISRYLPENAVQWALTLPEGGIRQSTLKNIYRQWPKDDPASASSSAAEAFAKEHGIK